MSKLIIDNLQVEIEGKQILKGVNLVVNSRKYMLLWDLTVQVSLL